MTKYETRKGHFIKPCPCSPATVSCGYFNLNTQTGCPYSCTYCILQNYLNSPEPVFFTNIKEIEHQLNSIYRSKKKLRIGNGELSDSLACDDQTNYATNIMKIFESYPEIIFEFKTKSKNIANILKYPRVLKNIVVSWSMNPQIIIEREELKTPNLAERLQAMAAIQERGYKIGIHIDPIIIIQNWQEYYKALVKEIAATILPNRIAWLSLGSLRFPYPLREQIFKYANSMLFSGELVKGYDGKYRYLKSLRVELFMFLKKIIQTTISEEIPMYLCMEDEEVWQEIFPNMNSQKQDINHTLYSSVLPEL